MLTGVAETIKKYNMLNPSERVCVALSGGADSVSLLLALMELGYRVFAVHVNHNLRGAESDRDERFCRELCQRLGVTLFCESVDVAGYCRENRVSTEEGARKLRYQEIENHLDGCRLATAHNLNDCFETALFNLVRGCGISGITGIPAVRGNIVRPLIRTTRAQIEEYLSGLGQEYVTDSTNLIDDCSRNIIRLNVIPQLLRINPSLYKTYLKTLDIFEGADRYIDSESSALLDGVFDEGGYRLSGCDDFILGEALVKLARMNGVEPSHEKIDVMRELCKSDGRINLRSGVYVRGESGKISFESDAEAEDIFVKTDLKGKITAGRYTVEFTEISRFTPSVYNKQELKYFINPEHVIGDTVIRSYLGNEKIRLLGRGFTSTVKKLLANTPPRERKQVLVIADEEGAIFVQGFGVAERVAACANTGDSGSDGSSVSAVKIDIF